MEGDLNDLPFRRWPNYLRLIFFRNYIEDMFQNKLYMMFANES